MENKLSEYIPRPTDLPSDLPWCERLFDPDDSFDPFVYDGSMSMDDYQLMWRNIDAERTHEIGRSNMSNMQKNMRIVAQNLAYEISEIRRAADSVHFIAGQLFEQFFCEAVDTLANRERVVYLFENAKSLANILIDYTLRESDALEALYSVSTLAQVSVELRRSAK